MERNLSRVRYLPRRTPSMSVMATLTLEASDFLKRSRALLLARVLARAAGGWIAWGPTGFARRTPSREVRNPLRVLTTEVGMRGRVSEVTGRRQWSGPS